MLKKKFLPIFLSLFFLSACGGGSTPFSLTLPINKIINVDEDNLHTSTITSTTNYKSIITYKIINDSINGQADITSSGDLSYLPSQDFFGNDSLGIQVTATRVDDENNPTGGVIVKNLTIPITINPVNDPPVITILDDLSNYSDLNLFFEETITVNVEITDVDNEISDLTFNGALPNESVNAELDIIQTIENDITIENQYIVFYLNNIETAGLYKMSICASDFEDTTCEGEIEGYYISNKEIKSIDYNCDDEGINCNSSDQYLYYLVGSENSMAKTDYIFIADQISGSEGDGSTQDFRQRLVESINRIRESDAGQLFQDYFNILVLEEVNPTGFSLFNIDTGCYSNWDPRIYCIGNVDRDLLSSVYDNWDVASFLTSIDGRGVAQGNINIQPLSDRTAEIVQHELGHSHAFLGDEYDSRGERTFPIYYADFSINTTSATDATKVKWSHLIDDLNLIPGYSDEVYQYCWNNEEGEVYTREGNTVNYEDCACFMNQFPDSEFPGTNADPSCPTKIGHFEGTYYGEVGTYRPRWLSVMWCCDDEYGKVNVEGFAIGSILNQGFTDYTIDSNLSEDIDLFDETSLGDSITFNLNAEYDTNKLKLKWYIDGEEQLNLLNQTEVSFDRPSDNSIITYSWKVEELTGDLSAPNDSLDPLDLYEGWFEEGYYYDPDENTNPNTSQNPFVSSWIWYKLDGSEHLDNEVDLNNPNDYLFAELCCSLGSAIKINWSNYEQDQDVETTKSNNKVLRTAKINNVEKIINLELSKEKIKVNNIKNELANVNQIKQTKISKTDIYTLSFYDENMFKVYTVGIGDPFNARVQHIGFEDSDIFSIDIPLQQYSIAIPNEVNAKFVSLNKRDNNNKYNLIQLIQL